MAKLTAVTLTIIGILMLLPLIGVTQLGDIGGAVDLLDWLIVIGVLVIAIGKLVRNFKK